MSELARKLGLKEGQTICLDEAPAASRALLIAECPAGVTFVGAPTGAGFDAVFFWPTTLDGLTERFDRLACVISVEGAVWAVLPNKRHAPQRGISFSWEQMQAAGLRTDLVDNKIVSLSPEEYATRFVIRKDRRARYA
jgi:hypothetical protein